MNSWFRFFNVRNRFFIVINSTYKAQNRPLQTDLWVGKLKPISRLGQHWNCISMTWQTENLTLYFSKYFKVKANQPDVCHWDSRWKSLIFFVKYIFFFGEIFKTNQQIQALSSFLSKLPVWNWVNLIKLSVIKLSK